MPIKEQLFNFTSTLHKLVFDMGLPPEQLAAIAEAINGNIDGMKDICKAMPAFDLAEIVHRQLDADIETQKQRVQPNEPPIRCGQGCTHCCRQIVACSPPEAELIKRTVKQKQIPVDYDRLHRQMGKNDQSWLEQPVEDRACVFLGANGLCQIYDQRPASCRKYFAISPPELCNIDRYPSQEVAVWFALDAEITTTAMFTEYGCEFLPDLMMKGGNDGKA